MKTAIFPGSFDPFTRGHEAVVKEALGLFDRVVVAIGDNCRKQALLALDDRKRLIDDLYAADERVECVAYDTLTGELARLKGATAIVRGVRNTVDFEYERTMAQINRRIFPDIATVVLFTPPELTAPRITCPTADKCATGENPLFRAYGVAPPCIVDLYSYICRR